MRERLVTVPGRDAVASAPGDASQMIGGAGRVLPHLLLLQGPARLDGIQIGRVGWQIQHTNPTVTTGRPHASVVMGPEVVHDEHIAAPQFWEQVSREPADETVGVRRGKHRAQDHPARVAHGAEQRQCPSPVHRHAFDVLGAALHPGVCTVHGDVDPGFVQKHEPIERNPTDDL